MYCASSDFHLFRVFFMLKIVELRTIFNISSLLWHKNVGVLDQTNTHFIFVQCFDILTVSFPSCICITVVLADFEHHIIH